MRVNKALLAITILFALIFGFVYGASTLFPQYLPFLHNPSSIQIPLYHQNIYNHLSSSPANQITKDKCSKTLTYTFDPKYGFCSTLSIIMNFFAYAQATGRQIFYNDKGWNYGRLKDYFIVDGFLSDCPKPNPGNHTTPSRTLQYLWEPIDHLFVNRYHYHALNTSWVYSPNHIKKNLVGVDKYRTIYDQKRSIMSKIWRFNTVQQSQFDEKMAELKEFMAEHKADKYVSVAMRFGDKLEEVLKNGYTTYIASINDYLEALDKVFEQMGLDHPVVVATSDDKAAPQLLQRKRPNWRVFQPYFKKQVGGHFQFEFNNQPLALRVQETREMLVELELHGQAYKVVCSNKSNLCRTITLLRGEGAYNVISVDREWFPQ
eukprot:TRINITY_DN6357_c0_g1_i1.p1 TRINITY_DN6357_c0_g1~~TRINITY_DN6357_c0_g1_i1.p1  ORF type:complete len:375 (-),score=44.92 TRINITY_DN6357_c0_g1_i1:66-1190(-)